MIALLRRLAPYSIILLAVVLAALVMLLRSSGGVARPLGDAAIMLPLDPTAGAPLPVTVRGRAAAPVEAWAAVARAGTDCRDGSAAQAPTTVQGAFRLDGDARVRAPGRYTVCAVTRDGAVTTVAVRRDMTVRATRGSVN